MDKVELLHRMARDPAVLACSGNQHYKGLASAYVQHGIICWLARDFLHGMGWHP